MRMMDLINRRGLLSAIGTIGAALAGPRLTAEEAPMVEEPWSAGGLAGTFTRPRMPFARGPTALIIAGSGPTPRDGNVGTYRLLAHGLAAAGIRSLRYDKRGVGGSRGLLTREEDVVLQSFVDDAVTAARDLEARADVSAMFMIGHSEGALIATVAAPSVALAGLVLLAAPGRRLDLVLREQLLAIPLPPAQEHLRQEGLDILARLVKGERVADVPAAQAPLFRPSVQPFLMSVFAVDPAAALAKLSLPVLLVRGASDIQVAAADLDALAKARPDARVLTLPATNHAFKPAPADLSDRAAQLKSYDPAAPLVPALVPAIADFIHAAAR